MKPPTHECLPAPSRGPGTPLALRRSLAVALAWGAFLTACTQTPPSATPLYPPPAMSLELTLSLPTEPVVAGALFPVQTTLRNRGTAPVDLPAAATLSPLTFIVFDRDGRSVVATGSARDALVARLGGVPVPQPPSTPLPPGGERTYSEEISRYLGGPIPAGSYRLKAQLGPDPQAPSSAGVPFEVQALRPDAVLRQTDVHASWLSTAVAHRRPNGPREIYVSHVDASGTTSPVLRPVLELGPGSEHPALALAPRLSADGKETWLATLTADGALGVLVQEFDSTNRFGPVPVPLAQPRLLPTGVATADGGAVFFATGTDAGRPALAIVSVTASGKPTPRVVRLEGPAPAGVPEVAVAFEGGTPRAHLCWQDGEHGVIGVDLDPLAPPAAGRIASRYSTQGRIAAMQASPPAEGDPARLDLVEVPPDRDARPVVVKLSLGREAKPESWPMPALAGVDLRGTDRWLLALSGVDAAGPLVAVSARTAHLLSGGSWQPVEVAKVAQPGAQLVRFGVERVWLSAWSPEAGLILSLLAP